MREATRMGMRMNSPQRVLFRRMPHNAPRGTHLAIELAVG